MVQAGNVNKRKESSVRRMFLAFFAIGIPKYCLATGGYGVAEAIGWLLLFAIGAVFLVFAGVGAALAKKKCKGALVGVGAAFALLVSFTVWISLESAAFHNGIYEMEANRNARADQTVEIMHDKCKRFERFVVNRTVAPGSSIFVKIYPKSESPTSTDAPPVFPTAAMKEEHRKYGRSFPPMYNVAQYKAPISWIADADRPETIAALMQANLIDSRDIYHTYGKKYYRLATKQRWLKDGLEDVAIAYTETYIDDYKFRNWPDEKFMVKIPIDQPNAKYVFTVEDVSSLDDRRDWLARGRIRLLDASNSDVIAEYVGFQSLLRKPDVCPNAISEAINSKGEWDMLRFFFGRVLQR